MSALAFRVEEHFEPAEDRAAAFSMQSLWPLDMRPTYVNEYSMSGADTLSLDQPLRRLMIEAAESAPNSASSLSASVEAINTLLSLPPGWDTYGALAPSVEAAKKAISILRSLARAGGRMPAIVPTSTGGIQLEWHNSGVDVEIEIEQNGAVSAFVETGSLSRVWANHQLPSDPAFLTALNTVLFSV